jgi:hypothetical protein
MAKKRTRKRRQRIDAHVWLRRQTKEAARTSPDVPVAHDQRIINSTVSQNYYECQLLGGAV